MFKIKTILITLTVIVVSFIASTQHAYSEVTAARKGKLSGVVKIQNKTPNVTLDVEQSDRPGSNTFVDTGTEITTDASGNGSVKISNLYSGRLLTGHTVRVGTNTATVVRTSEIWPSIAQGKQVLPELVIPQAAGVNTQLPMIETWNPGTFWVLRLDPQEGVWFDAGAVLQTDGDLQAELIDITPQEIVIQIIGDPTFDTIDDIHLFGIGIDILPGVTELLPQIGMLGSTDYYMNQEFFGTELADKEMLFVPTQPIPVELDPQVLPFDLQITSGQPAAGSLLDLQVPDNNDMSIRRSNTDVQSRTSFAVAGISPLPDPLSLEFIVEGSVFARSQVDMTIELWNFETDSFEFIDTQPAPRFVDDTFTFEPVGDLSRFVEDGTLNMIAHVRFNSLVPRQKFTSHTDFVGWVVNSQ